MRKHDLWEKTEKGLGTLNLQQRKKAVGVLWVLKHSREDNAGLPYLHAAGSIPALARARMLYSAFPALGTWPSPLGTADGTSEQDCNNCRLRVCLD